MTQIPIVSGIYSDANADMRTSYPVNMVPVPKVTGVSQGYLRIADGITANGSGDGVTRGGIEWNGVLYRVIGTKFVSVASDGTVTTIGDVGGGGPVSMTYGFDYLAIASGGNMFLYNGVSLAQNTDPDLGTVLDVVWIGGYFAFTDGENIAVTELGDPFSVNPLKYSSSEIDPDPIVSLLYISNELYAVNRNTIEIFRNVGGDNSPFQRIDGAQVGSGSLGTHCTTEYLEHVAFIGGGRNDAPGIMMGRNGQATRISTREIDLILAQYTEGQLSNAVMEVRSDLGNEVLIVHLPNHTICFDYPASQALEFPVWYYLSSGTTQAAWDARHLVWAYDRWNVGSPTTSQIGYLTRDTHEHWSSKVRCEFATPIVYNEARSVQFHELELITMTGATAFGDNPLISTEYSDDGITWSQPRTCPAGGFGQRDTRLRWTRQGTMRGRRMQRFRFDSDAPISVMRLEARLEPLAW